MSEAVASAGAQRVMKINSVDAAAQKEKTKLEKLDEYAERGEEIAGLVGGVTEGGAQTIIGIQTLSEEGLDSEKGWS